MGPPPTPKFIHELMVIHKKVSTVHTTHKPFATWDEPPEYCLASPLWCKTGDREERHTGKKGCKKKWKGTKARVVTVLFLRLCPSLSTVLNILQILRTTHSKPWGGFKFLKASFIHKRKTELKKKIQEDKIYYNVVSNMLLLLCHN